jgi:hypothetical protein
MMRKEGGGCEEGQDGLGFNLPEINISPRKFGALLKGR